MKRDLTKLESYADMTWDQAIDSLKTCGLMLAFGKDRWAIDVVKTLNNYGEEAGMAVLVSALFLKKHGAGATATTATGIYSDIAKEQNSYDLRCRIHNLEYLVYFADTTASRNKSWPMKWPFTDAPRRAGLANVMLAMSMQELGREGSTTCEKVAALGIQIFFEKKRDENQNISKTNQKRRTR